MPELPEVETIRRGLVSLVDKKIAKIFRSNKKLRIESSLDLQGLEGAKILEVSRRARYLIIKFSNKKTLVIHLGMSGRVTIHQVGERQKHDHFILRFTNGSQLVFNDPRRFGFVDLIETKNLLSHQFLTSLGLEPISADFNSTYLQTKLRNKITNIKTALMDNKLVVGVGNIYANESLFDAGILPLRSAKSLTKSDLSSLVSSVKKIITKAIRLGGSSISDYVDSRGESGKFQNSFKVYGRGGEKCLQCSRAIQRVVQAGRASFYCSQCQT